MEQTLICMLLLLVMAMKMAKISTLSETHGQLSGVNKVTLELLLSKVKVSVEFKLIPPRFLQTELSNEK